MSFAAIEDKIPQLFMIADYGDEALVLKEKAGESLAEVTARIDRLVSQYHVGGVLFKGQWTPTGLRERIRHLQALSTTPLFFAQDVEWGLAMRHVGVIELPKALCMGAINDDSAIDEWATAIALTAHDVGINLILGPDADVNVNPKNPVIHDRSFGDRPQEVAKKVCAVIRAFKRVGIGMCVKHFPGHGNTAKDSHFTLPVVDATLDQLNRQELVPFKAAIDAGADCIMTAHLALPNACQDGLPSSLSPFWCQHMLREVLQFRGVIITDDLIMGGASGSLTATDIAVRAVQAGNDLCIVSRDMEACFDSVKKAVSSGGLQEHEIDEHVCRVTALRESINPHGSALSEADLVRLHESLYQRAVTCVGQAWAFSPDTTLVVNVGNGLLCPLGRDLAKAFPTTSIAAVRRAPTKDEEAGLLRAVEDRQEILVVLSDLERSPALAFGITPELVQMLRTIQDKGVRIRYVLFGSPYILSILPQPILSALVAYEHTMGSEQAVLAVLGGKAMPTGVLPVHLLPS
jgi:beta-glucosidase-like glycosyl hydrolase